MFLFLILVFITFIIYFNDFIFVMIDNYKLSRLNGFSKNKSLLVSSYLTIIFYKEKATKYIKSFRSNVTIHSKRNYDINYTMTNGNQYTLRLKVKKGFKPKYTFFEDNIDVSDKVEPFLGPYKDFHDIEYTPENLGYEHLKVRYSNGIQEYDKLFNKNDIISLVS